MKISNSKINYDIVVCGTGATGSQLLPFLTQLLAYSEGNTLTLIDEDRIELKNCKNQKFLPDDESKYKAEVLCKRYKTVYPKLNIRYVPEFVKSTDRLMELANSRYSTHNNVLILVGCVDNNPTRKVFGEFFHAYSRNIIYIDSGNGTLDRIGQIVVACKIRKERYGSSIFDTIGDVETPCPYDLFEEVREDKDSVDKATSCGYNTDANPQNIATNVMAASTLFSILTNLIQFNEVTPGIAYFDAEKPGIIFRSHEVTQKGEDTNGSDVLHQQTL